MLGSGSGTVVGGKVRPLCVWEGLPDGFEERRVLLGILTKLVKFLREDVFCCECDSCGMGAADDQTFFKECLVLRGLLQFGIGGDKLVQ